MQQQTNRFVGGIQGVYEQQCVELTDEMLATYRNQGGLDLLGRRWVLFNLFFILCVCLGMWRRGLMTI